MSASAMNAIHIVIDVGAGADFGQMSDEMGSHGRRGRSAGNDWRREPFVLPQAQDFVEQGIELPQSRLLRSGCGRDMSGEKEQAIQSQSLLSRYMLRQLQCVCRRLHAGAMMSDIQVHEDSDHAPGGSRRGGEGIGRGARIDRNAHGFPAASCASCSHRSRSTPG